MYWGGPSGARSRRAALATDSAIDVSCAAAMLIRRARVEFRLALFFEARRPQASRECSARREARRSVLRQIADAKPRALIHRQLGDVVTSSSMARSHLISR